MKLMLARYQSNRHIWLVVPGPQLERLPCRILTQDPDGQGNHIVSVRKTLRNITALRLVGLVVPPQTPVTSSVQRGGKSQQRK